MLTSGQGNSAGPLPLPVSPEQVVVMLGPLVAAAAYRGSNHSHATTTTATTATKTDLSFRVGHAHNTTSPLDDTGQASSGRRHQDNTVNANYSSTSLAGALFDLPPPPAALNSTHQLIRNLLFQANNDNNDTTTYNSDHHNFTQYHHHETITTTTTTRGPFTSYEWLMIVTLVTIILISIVGNLLVCVAIFTDRRLRKLGNAFIVSLAIADLFVSFLVMTFALHNDLMEQWIFGAWFCDIWISFDIMCCTASILNLCAISLDRFIHIKDCLLYNQLMTRRVAISAVIMIWIISGLVSFVPITLGWHRPSVVTPNSPPGQAHLHLAAAAEDDIARTTTELPVNLASTARSKRAAPQIAHKLNYAAGAWARTGAASGHDADGHLASEANEPIGSADASSLRRLNMTQEAGLALLDPAANGRDRDRGEGKQAILMRANERAHASRVAGPTREPKKSNLGEEQIKHLPRARRRRQVAAQSTGRASPTLASSSGDDYDGEDEELARGQLEREQTSQRAHSTGRQFDARALNTGREPLQAPGAQQAAAAAQCMLTLTPTYAVISSTISFYIPCIIMLGLYSKLFACARRHVRNIKAISKAPQPIGGGGCTTNATNNNAANNNHISSSSGSSSTTANTGNSSHRNGRSAGLLVNCARRLIGARSNQRKSAPDAAGCITETTCGPASTPQAADKVQRGKLARCVGSRARTWIKLRAGGGGENATQNSTKARCTSNRENVATTADNDNDNESGARLVLKSILSNQKQQHRDRPAGHSQLPRHGAEDNNTLTHSGDSTTASANAELEPFLASAGGGVGVRVGGEARKSLVSTNALGVKLNMIGADAAASVGAGAGASAASARSPMHQNQNQQQQQEQERQLHARLQQQQQQQPPQPLQPTKQQTSQLATHKAAITLGIIMGTFLLCWLPFFCLNIIKAFYGDLIPAWLFRAFTWLGYANSALNPIIYGIHNSEFRNAFNRIFFKHLTLKNGRQYLNRRFSYDLRPHHHHHQQHQNSNNHHLTVAVTGQTRRRVNHSDTNNNNNISSQQSAQTGPIPMIVAANAAISSDRPNELVGLARGEVHAQNNKPQCAQPAATAAPVKMNPRAAHGQGRASSLAMGSSLDPYDQRQQCLNLLNCLQERAGQTSTAPSISNTTVHRTSEDLSQGGVRVAAVAQVAPTSDLEEQPTLPQQVQPQTVAIS